jgi:GntR family transcriptional regulator
VITTKRAYDELEQEGLVASVSGKGTFVSGVNKESVREIKYKQLEERIKELVIESRSLGLKQQEVWDIFQIFYGEE